MINPFEQLIHAKKVVVAPERVVIKGSQASIRGLSTLPDGRLLVRGEIDGVRTILYRGSDLFEACCVRKSWENQNDRKG